MKLLFLTTTFILACFSVVRCKPPNIVMFLTDDLDNQLGGVTPLTKTKKWIGDKGANFNNAFVVVPVCCPSRYTSNQIPADRLESILLFYILLFYFLGRPSLLDCTNTILG